MSDRIGEDALLDVGCFLDRFEVDSIQCLTWKSHTYLANKGHILPLRLLHKAQIIGYRMCVTAQDRSRGSVSSDGTPQEALELALVAIKDSEVKYLTLFDPVTEQEVTQIAAVAPAVKVTDLRLCGRLTDLSPSALHRLMFSFASVQEFTLNRFNGNQLTDEHLRECGRKQTSSLRAITESADAGPLAFSDDALLDYLFAPEHGMSERRVDISAFNASPHFVQKLISRALLATNVDRVDLEVKRLPLGSQQLGGIHLTQNGGIAEHFERLENGARLRLQFGREAVPPRRASMMDEEDESEDKFRFTLRK
ncbi:hypothetical protein AAVH_12447 [Aphelenchoides avenae]|nr:hypothetical protein AAVH_12447 [Aphelenchus avenae]